MTHGAPVAWGTNFLCLAPLDTFVVIDFETTGLSPHSDEIIEIAAARIRPGERHAEHFQQLVKVDRKLPRHIVRLTGITDQMLDAEGGDRCEALARLVEFIAEDCVVAYNASFDIGFLRAACARHGTEIGATGGMSCALSLARRVWPRLPSYKLNYVAARLGLDMGNQHRALSDVKRAAEVYRAGTVEFFGLHHLLPPDVAAKVKALNA